MWMYNFIGLSKYSLIGFFILLVGCSTQPNQRVFEQIHSDQTNIHFANELTPTEEFNMYLFRNFYNGGGVAVGDINDDGLPDIFLTGNMVSNRLYINEGSFSFKEVTKSAGLLSDGYWSTGASMADINGDGWLDIFVALSGPNEGTKRHNRLYLNNQDGTFTEAASKWGLNHIGLSTSAHFFDSDRDGDLDLLLLTNSFENLESFNDARGDWRKNQKEGAGMIFYENQGDKFIESTQKAGFYQNSIAFPLSASIGDINNDGWPDVFIANDFFERDYLFLNDGDGTYTESFEPPLVFSGSLSSMGSDFADISNDGLLDLYVSDMRPHTSERFHSKMNFETWQEFTEQQKRGFGAQMTRNTFFQTVSLVTNQPVLEGESYKSSIMLSEQSRMTKSEASDWSWAVLIADYDLNGLQDILVTNGIGVDLLDQDYIDQMMNPRVLAERYRKGESNIILSMLENLDSEPQSNMLYAQFEDLQFENSTKSWGLDTPSFSSGAAWGDLDKDGDLDLIINDVNGPAKIYRNNSIESSTEPNKDKNWFAVSLRSNDQNTHAIGTRVDLWTGNIRMRRDQYSQRGFQSSVEPGLWFGLGTNSEIDSIRVVWSDGTTHLIKDGPLLAANQKINLLKQDSNLEEFKIPSSTNDQLIALDMSPETSIPFKQMDPSSFGIQFSHRSFEMNEFQRDPLLFHMRSTEGPALCKGDINGDGYEDFYIGGARDQKGALYIQNQNGAFSQLEHPQLVRELDAEEVDCAIFDANNDGFDDLYIVSGGNSLVSSSTALSDRMILTVKNDDGSISFEDTNQFLPINNSFESTSIVAPHDFTGDGILDLFVGTRLKPFKVGLPVNGYLLKGDGKGFFQDVTQTWAPELNELGMITHAIWADVQGDEVPELIISGEYMPMTIFARNTQSNGSYVYENITNEMGLTNTNGWWNRVLAEDIDKDGQIELIGLNHGLNSIFRASVDKPVTLWVGDFTQNGLIEHVLAINIDDKNIPVALKHKMEEHIPYIGQRFPTYASYAGKAVEEMFTSEELNRAVKLEAMIMESVIIDWDSDKMSNPSITPLARWAQVSPMFGAIVSQFEEKKVLLLGGNHYKVKPQVGAYDASVGTVIDLVSNTEWDQSGFEVFGEIREIMQIDLYDSQKGELTPILIVARHNDYPVVFSIN